MSIRESIRRRTAEQLLVLRCQLGDERAFEKLFQRYHDPVLYYLRRLSGDPAAAEDLFQAVWLQVYRKIATLRDSGAFRTWLFRIAHNKAVQRFRSLAQETSLEEAASTALPEEDPPESAPLDPARVHAALDRLSPAHREALTLRFLGEMSYVEIAGVTGCSLGTVRSRIHYAKRALRHALEAIMTDRTDFGADLMAQNGTRDPESRKRRVSEMMTLVAEERAAVRRLRIAAFVAWGLALLLPAGVLGMFYAQTLGPFQDEAFWARVYLVSPIVAMSGAVCLVVAAITTLAWFFRARTASLAAIEARLASLERLLSSETERPGR